MNVIKIFSSYLPELSWLFVNEGQISLRQTLTHWSGQASPAETSSLDSALICRGGWCADHTSNPVYFSSIWLISPTLSNHRIDKRSKEGMDIQCRWPPANLVLRPKPLQKASKIRSYWFMSSLHLRERINDLNVTPGSTIWPGVDAMVQQRRHASHLRTTVATKRLQLLCFFNTCTFSKWV